MHIVIASAFDPIPSDGISLGRYHYLAMALREKGHELSIVSSTYSHANKKFRTKEPEEFMGIHYYKVPCTAYQSNLGLKRILNHFRLALNVNNTLSKINAAKPIDFIICASPPLLWTARILSFCQANSIKSLLDIQDNWPKAFESINPILYKMSLNGFPLSVLEKRNLKKADAITAVSQDYLKRSSDKKSAVFFLGAPIQSIKVEVPKLIQQPSEKLRLVFMGNISSHKYLLEFLDKYKQEKIELSFIGECIDRRIKNHRLVNYLGKLYKRELYLALMNHDYGLFINDQFKQISLPNKLFYYWALGLPILGIDIKREANTLIREMNGTIVSMDNIDFRQLNDRYNKIDREWIRDQAIARFDEKVIYSQFADFIESVAHE